MLLQPTDTATYSVFSGVCSVSAGVTWVDDDIAQSQHALKLLCVRGSSPAGQHQPHSSCDKKKYILIFPVQHGDTVDDSDGADNLQAGHLNLNSTDTVGIYDIYGSLVGSPAARCLLWQSFKSDLFCMKCTKQNKYCFSITFHLSH